MDGQAYDDATRLLLKIMTRPSEAGKKRHVNNNIDLEW
jgi:hypothetical protein